MLYWVKVPEIVYRCCGTSKNILCPDTSKTKVFRILGPARGKLCCNSVFFERSRGLKVACSTHEMNMEAKDMLPPARKLLPPARKLLPPGREELFAGLKQGLATTLAGLSKTF